MTNFQTYSIHDLENDNENFFSRHIETIRKSKRLFFKRFYRFRVWRRIVRLTWYRSPGFLWFYLFLFDTWSMPTSNSSPLMFSMREPALRYTRLREEAIWKRKIKRECEKKGNKIRQRGSILSEQEWTDEDRSLKWPFLTVC